MADAAELPTPPASVHATDGWRDRWLRWRDRLLASRGFRHRAAAFAPTAPIARARAAQLFDLVAGFVYSQVLLACVQLRLFDLLAAEGPLDAVRLAQRLALTPEAADRLLGAAVSLRLLERRSRGRVGLGSLGAPLVGNAALVAMVEHHAALYEDLRDPVALLRSGKGSGALAAYWPYAAAPESGSAAEAGARASLGAVDVARYSALMATSLPLVADEILDAYPVGRHRCLLDVGGGEGAFAEQAAQRHAGLKAIVFDLPAVAERARRRIADSGLAARVRVAAGDFFDGELPVGADLATLVRVIHDHDDEGALAIVRQVHRALPRGGVLLLAEPMSDTPGAQAMGDAYFGFYLLAMGQGRPRSAEALTRLLHAAGFADVRRLRTRMPLQTGLLRARKD